MFQNIVISGHLGNDPQAREVNTSRGATTVCNFSIATNSYRGNGEQQVTWWRVTAWGRQAEVCTQYLSKGRSVIVMGEMIPDDNGNPRVWEDASGNSRASYEIRAHTVRFIGGSGNGNGGNNANTPEIPPAAGPEPQVDELPF